MNLRAILYLTTFSLIITACSNKEDKQDVENITESPADLSKQINVQNFFNTIPPAPTVFDVIQKSALAYNPDFLNDPTKYKNYSLENSRALNIGVYGADLAITGAFNQAQESMLYLKCTNYLAQQLGIQKAFDNVMMERMEANKENRDSTLEIISNAFKRSDGIFSENKRGYASALMIIGAWVESMYVAGEFALVKSNNNINPILTLYFKQKESLNYLINLLANSKEDPDFREISEQLKAIQQKMNNINNNIEQLREVHGTIKILRDKIVNTY